MRFQNGLAFSGGEWHYRFFFLGRRYQGSTRCSEFQAAVKWVNNYKSHL